MIDVGNCQLTRSQIGIYVDKRHRSAHQISAEWIKDHTQLP
jgi:hypothetical protein